MLRLLFAILLNISLAMGANPKVYAGIGDPLYRDLESTDKLSRLHAFKPEKKELQAYVKELKIAKKEGFKVQKYKDKAAAKAYIHTLRRLETKNKKISKLVKIRLLEAIQRDHTKRVQQITATRHSIFYEDPTLKKAIPAYKRKLKKQQKIAKREYKAYLKSPKNFKGVWKNNETAWKFGVKSLTITNITKSKIQQIEGDWKLKEPLLVHTIHTITNQSFNKHPHTRKTKVTQNYTLVSITKKVLKVKDFNGNIIILKR